MKSFSDRFWEKVQGKDSSGCWIWTASKRNGYGEIWKGQQHLYAHRVSWELAFGPLPKGAHVGHYCGNPACVNPKHLYVHVIVNSRERFWSKVDIRNPNECWEWKAGRFIDGYGQFSKDNKSLHAHRVAWELTYGPIPKGMCVLHRCDNPCCCNPAHLWLGTIADNNADRDRKGRGNAPRGEQHGESKLREFEVREIRRSSLPQTQLAQVYGVSYQTVSRIKRFESWAWLDKDGR